MLIVPATVFGVFGSVSVAGGVLGWKKAGSRASLIAGTATGALLLASSWMVASGASEVGLLVGGVTSALLAGRFVPGFVKTRKWMPHGMMSVLSVASLTTAVAAYF